MLGAVVVAVATFRLQSIQDKTPLKSLAREVRRSLCRHDTQQPGALPGSWL
jgi:hypothetical protein